MDLLLRYANRERLRRSDLQNADVGQLQELKNEVDADTAIIDSQLDLAANKLRETGKYQDADWFTKAKLAKRLKGQLSQMIQTELGRRKKIQKDANRKMAGRLDALLEAMKLVLTDEQRAQVLDKAKELEGGDADYGS